MKARRITHALVGAIRRLRLGIAARCESGGRSGAKRFVTGYVVAFLIVFFSAHAIKHRPSGEAINRAAGEILRHWIPSRFDPMDPAVLVIDSSGLPVVGKKRVLSADAMISLIEEVAACSPSAIAIDYDLGWRSNTRYEEHTRIASYAVSRRHSTPPIILGVGEAVGIPRDDWFAAEGAEAHAASIWLPSDLKTQPARLRLPGGATRLPSLGVALAERAGAVRERPAWCMRPLLAEVNEDGLSTESFAIDYTPLRDRDRWTIFPEVSDGSARLRPEDKARLTGKMVVIGIARLVEHAEASDLWALDSSTLPGVYQHAVGAWSWTNPIYEIDDRYDSAVEVFLAACTLCLILRIAYGRKREHPAEHARHAAEGVHSRLRIAAAGVVAGLALAAGFAGFYWASLVFVFLTLLIEPLVATALEFVHRRNAVRTH